MPTTDIEDHNDIRLADGVTAYHGSPHEFEEFDPAFIGTGEGAQAYGHGLYFAQKEDVAKAYAESAEDKYSPGIIARHALKAWPDKDTAIQKQIQRIDRLEKSHDENFIAPYREALNILKSGKIPKAGHMYEVRIDAHPEEHMLDWDKPLNEQQAYNLVRKHWDDRVGDPDIVAERLGINEESTGRDLYEALAGGQRKQEEASKMLSDIGVRGIRYADQGSRPHGTDSKIKKDLQSARNNLEHLEKSSDPENEYLKELSKKHIAYLENILNDYASKTTHNYVIFDPQHIKTVRRYAEGGGIKAFAIGNSIPHLERASDMIETHDDIQLAPGVEAIDEMPDEASYQDMKVGPSSVSYKEHPSHIEISSVRTPQKHRGKGAASSALNALHEIADKKGKKVRLLASPLDKKTRLDRLVNLYKKHGYELTGEKGNLAGDPWMERKPAKAYGGSIIPGPKLTEENADDFARRLIAWTFATAPLFHKASGGSVIDAALDVVSKLRR